MRTCKLCRLLRKYQIGLKGKLRVCSVIDMAPKSSDGEVNDGSSRDPELTEPIETSTGVASSSLLGSADRNSQPWFDVQVLHHVCCKRVEFPDAPLLEYQAKAAWSVTNKTYPMFCRSQSH